MTAVIVFAGVSAALHVGKLAPSIPVLQQALGISLVQAGFLLSAVQMAGMSLGLLIGLGAESLGLRRTVLAGLAVLAGASLAGGFVQGIEALMALRALEGLGFLLTVMPGPSLIRRHSEQAQINARMGWWGTYMPTGNALALLIGPFLLSSLHWPAWWWLLGAVSVLAWLAVFYTLPADPPAARASLPAKGPAPVGGASAARADSAGQAGDTWAMRLRHTLAAPGPWLVSLCFAVYAAQWTAIIGFLPTIYAQSGLRGLAVSVMTALVAWINVLGNVASGRLLGRGWQAARLLMVGYGCMALGSALAFVEIGGDHLPVPLQFAGVLLFSAVGGLIPGTLFALAVRLAPVRGTVSATVGYMQQWSSLGQFAGPPLVAWVASLAGGWGLTWLVTASLSALGLCFAAVVNALGRPKP